MTTKYPIKSLPPITSNDDPIKFPAPPPPPPPLPPSTCS